MSLLDVFKPNIGNIKYMIIFVMCISAGMLMIDIRSLHAIHHRIVETRQYNVATNTTRAIESGGSIKSKLPVPAGIKTLLTWQSAELSCDGLIQIESALHGLPSSVCNDTSNNVAKNCTMDVTQITRAACQGKANCVVKVGDKKYLSVNYKCTNSAEKSKKPPQSPTKTKEIQPRPAACSTCNEHNFKYLVNEEDICGKDGSDAIHLIILILSAGDRRTDRDLVRRSWASIADKNKSPLYRYVFLLGKNKDENVNSNILNESQEMHDIIQEDFTDTYHNLTLKTIMGFKWLTTYCPKAKYVLKTDDDMFVHVANLVHVLDTTDISKQVMGKCWGFNPIRDKNSKWFASKMSFPGGRGYPNVKLCSGTGYAMEAQTAKDIYGVSKNIPFFHLEDVYVGLCIHALGYDKGYNHKAQRGFNSGGIGEKINDKHFVCECILTIHYLGRKKMESTWEAMRELDCVTKSPALINTPGHCIP